MSEHKVTVSGVPELRLIRAECSCGWKGPEREETWAGWQQIVKDQMWHEYKVFPTLRDGHDVP